MAGVPHRNRYDNPNTDKFEIVKFHHLEFTACDAISTMKLLKQGVGMELVAETKDETGNHTYCSYVLETHDIRFVVTAPYLAALKHPDDHPPNPHYDAEKAKVFFTRHGNGVSAVGIEVKDAREAYAIAIKNGAKGMNDVYVYLRLFVFFLFRFVVIIKSGFLKVLVLPMTSVHLKEAMLLLVR